jgi:hypothetical protein
MSGALARKGFRFQDLYLLRRVLEESASRFSSILESESPKPLAEPRFGIEVGTSAGSSADWDSVIEYDDRTDLIEAKSGSISRGERIRFWRRLRREVQLGKTVSINAVLAVDPSIEETAKWDQLASFASTAAEVPISEEPERVSTAAQLFAEAIWWMCHAPESQAGSPALSWERARLLLTSFRLASITSDALEANVLSEIELLFPDGLSDQISDSILGWLNRRAIEKEKGRRYFSVRELLGEMNILQQSIAFQSGTLQRWKTLWSELSALFVERARARLGKGGESISLGESQPDIEKQLGLRNENFVIVGKAGGGKTALLAQFGAQADKAGAEVFRCNADAVTEDELQDLFRSLRFKRAMCSVRAPQKQMCVLVDALDETEVTLRTKWAKQLARYGVTASATVVVSIRDSAWDGDGVSRSRLQHWHKLIAHEWSEELVRRLISERWSKERISVGLLELIRQPLMLDIFWRTFIEAERAVIERSVPRTRHELLSAFWQERLIQSSRHKILGLQQRLERVIAHAASSIANFRVENADDDALNILLSESVVITEGRLTTQYRFRHPLLRDFAIGVWCISAENESGVAQRWAQIRGGLQRHGALRAIFEALADEQFAAEHAHLSRAKIVDVLLNSQPEAAAHLAHIFGTNAPEAPFDPALWPMALQQKLPATFGTELLVAARLAGNVAWSQPVANWPADAHWIDDRFPEELLNFIGSLAKGASHTQESQQNYARLAAIKLRDLSEHSRFRPHFETNARWLKMAAMREIIPLVPDEQTLQWIERETPVASWRTRGFLLDRLIYVAPVHPVRTAEAYCAAVGLKQENGFPVLDPECWSDSLMDHHAIEWSLEGKDGRRAYFANSPKRSCR